MSQVKESRPLRFRCQVGHAYTADALAYSPAPPTYYGLVDFDGGGRMKIEFADVEEQDVEVGREVAMMFRIHAIDEQRKFKRYFWKAAPVVSGA